MKSWRIAVRVVAVAALVSHWLELLPFVFAKLAEAFFHPGLFTLTWCTLSSVSAAYMKIITLREAVSMDSLFWCHIRLASCIVDSVTQFYFWYFRKHTYNLWDKKVIEAVIVHCTQALTFPLYFPLFINNDKLTDLTHILLCTDTPYVWERPAKA